MLDATALKVADALGLLAYPYSSVAQLERLAFINHQACGYDTTAKQLWALGGRDGDPPGMDADEYWQGWLEYGRAGTCYATTNAIDELARALGFDCYMAGWHIVGIDDGITAHHATNVFVVGGVRYLLETSSSVPTVLRWPEDGGATGDRAKSATLAKVNGNELLYVPRAGVDGIKVYELAYERMGRDELVEQYRDTVRWRAKDQDRMLVARTLPDGVTGALFEGRLLLRRGLKVVSTNTVSQAAAVSFLQRVGFSDAWVSRLVDAGALDFASRPIGVGR